MKKIFIIVSIATIAFSCTKKESQKAEIHQNVDSINAARTKINESINVLNNKNRFKDFSGNHQFTHNLIKNSGSVDFKKIGRDEYEISGKAKSGKDFLEIKGTAKIGSEKYFSFTGNISQSISDNDNGKIYTRKGTKTFSSKDGGKTYRLQDMVNGSGFVDYIDIHF